MKNFVTLMKIVNNVHIVVVEINVHRARSACKDTNYKVIRAIIILNALLGVVRIICVQHLIHVHHHACLMRTVAKKDVVPSGTVAHQIYVKMA